MSVVYEQGRYIRPDVDSVNVQAVDWGNVWDSVVDFGEGVVGTVVDTAVDVGSFAWNHAGQIVVGTVVVAGLATVGFLMGGPAGAFAGASAALLMLNPDNDNDHTSGGI